MNKAFAMPGSETFVSGNRNTNTITIWREWEIDLANFDGRELFGLGGWSLSNHHWYSPQTSTLYRGDGTRHTAALLNRVPLQKRGQIPIR